MTLTEQQIDEIKKIIAKHFNAFLLSTLGPEALSSEDLRELQRFGMLNYIFGDNLFKHAFLAGKTRKGAKATLNPIDYDKWRTNNFNEYLTAIDKDAVKHIVDSSNHYTKKLVDGITNSMLEKVLESNRDAARSNLGSPIGPDPTKKITQEVNVKKLAKELEQQTGDKFRDWERVVTTELNAAYSQGAVHAILEDNIQKNPNDILVYAEGPLDAGTCKWCKKFYHDGNSFKVYRLTELLANGTNMGRKTKDWMAVVPPMHPRCRHRIVELPQGFSLNENGQVYFVGNEHHDLNTPIQKSLKGKVPTFSGWKLQDRYTFQGMKISIERKAGSYRVWKDRNGKSGKTLMKYDYGYIRNTLGSDDDHVDCYVGPNMEAANAYIIHQLVPSTGQHDEEKVMLGFDSAAEAKKAYLAHYDSPKFFGSMTTMPMAKFKVKVIGKRTNIIKGAANHKYVKRTGSPGNYKYWYKDLVTGQMFQQDVPRENAHAKAPAEKVKTKKLIAKKKDHLKLVQPAKDSDELTGMSNTGNQATSQVSSYKRKLGWYGREGEIDGMPLDQIQQHKNNLEKQESDFKAYQEATVAKLNPMVIDSLEAWTSQPGPGSLADHYQIRQFQRGQDLEQASPKKLKLLNRIVSTIEKNWDNLPKFEGAIYRGIDVPPAQREEFFNSMQEGSTFSMEAFTSFSRKKTLAEGFGNYVFVINKNTKGRDVSFAGGYQSEEEILVKKDTKYKVVSVKQGNGNGVITLEEVNDGSTK